MPAVTLSIETSKKLKAIQAEIRRRDLKHYTQQEVVTAMIDAADNALFPPTA